MNRYNNNYTVLHCHTMLSNATTIMDSVTTFQQYIDKAKECDMKAMAISEHGSVFEWWHKKCAMEKVGIKYIHACEVYVTKTLEEKVRDNYHCLLVCTTHQAVKELNKMISKSFNRSDGHYYFNPRITFDELKSTSKDIIVCSACIGGIFGKGDVEIKNDFLKFFIKNKDRCYLEIQHHNTKEQIEYNNKLIKIANKYDLELVATTDTHCLDQRHAKGRSILQISKDTYFDDEGGWDLTFKTYDELCQAFKAQGIDESVYLKAIENTNVIADRVQEFTMDKNTKYPKIYDNGKEVLKNKVALGYKNNKYVKQRHSREDVLKVLESELDAYEKVGAIDFMLLQTHLREWEIENGVQCGYGRGSVSGSLIAYLLNITQMDSLEFNLNFFRFINPNRMSNADIDTDYSGFDREKVKTFILRDKMDLPSIRSSEIITFNTIALKGAVRDVCRALYKDSETTNYLELSKFISDNLEANEDKMREEYKEVFEYVDIVNGTIVSIGSHPSGVLVTDLEIDEEIGLCSLGESPYPVSMLNMKELDDLFFVKLDILGLDSIGVINETCKLANIDRLTPDNVDLDDEKVWKDIRDDTTLIFQWEGEQSGKYLKQFMSDETVNKVRDLIPNFSYIKWFSFGNGLIRPACASYKNEVAQGKFYSNGFDELDKFLSPTMGRVTMQEDIMQFLVKFCGYSQAESDNVRRGIAKKYGTEKLLPEIEERFIEYSSTTYNVGKNKCKEIIKPFLEVILSASSYAFSWNHSDAYSCIGYICGYLRYYYPLEFITSALGIFEGNEQKTLAISSYAKSKRIKINNPRFRHSKSTYMYDKSTNSIYKGVSSIKKLNTTCGDYLYSIRNNVYKNFIELLKDIPKDKVNKAQMEILIRLNFFEEFGEPNTLLNQVEIFKTFGNVKSVKRDKYDDFYTNIIAKCCAKETPKTFSQIDNDKLVDEIIKAVNIEPMSKLQYIQNELALLGYSSTIDESIDADIWIVGSISIDRFNRSFASLYNPYFGLSKTFEVINNRFNQYLLKTAPIVSGNALKCVFKDKDVKKYMGEDEKGKKIYMPTGEKVSTLFAWSYK